MSKTTLKATLSKDSFGNLAKQVMLYNNNYQKGVKLGIEEATKQCYEIICESMKSNNLSSHTDNVKWEFNELSNVGKISTTDIVIMFHEFGTGIKGTQDEWSSAFGYTVNQSGKGEKGWYFVNEKGGYDGITHGLTSKHIFFNALLEIQKMLPKTVQISVSKTIGEMY